MSRARLLLLFAVLLLAGAWSTARPSAVRWFRGNTHTHTLWSDADGAPELVTSWYREHGYQFLVLSDHNVMLAGERWFPIDDPVDARLSSAQVDELRAQFGADSVQVRDHDGRQEMRLHTLEELRERFRRAGEFLLIPGEEITDGTPLLAVHVNGLNLAELIPPQGGASALEIAQHDLDAIVAQGARLRRPVLGHLNHPNFRWALTADDVAQLRTERFFEIYNGHPATNTNGDATHPGTEELWDRANLRRRYELDLPLLYGLASDDSHDHHALGADKSNCGRGWIVVRAAELSTDALFTAMRAGDFYASSGVALDDVRFDGKTLTVDIAAEPGLTYTTRFLGAERKDGAPQAASFAETSADPAVYTLRGDEGYVRAKVTSSRAKANAVAAGELECAWTQPVRPR